MINDAHIIEQVISGNTNEFGQLVDKYQQIVFKTCLGFVHDHEDANDLSQEVFIKAFQNLSTFNKQSSFSTWLYRIAVNTSLNSLRQRRDGFFQRLGNWASPEKSGAIEISSEYYGNPEEIFISGEMEQLVAKELSKLSENQQTAFVLSKYDQLPQKEIAQIMGLSEGAVESLIQRAKANLVKKISGYLKKS